MQIASRIFQNADQEDIVIVPVQLRFNVFKVSDMNGQIAAVPMTVRVDQRSLSGKVHAVDIPAALCQNTGNGSRPRSDLQNLLASVKRNPSHNVAANGGKMVQRRPVLRIPDDGVEFFLRIILCNFQNPILHLAVTVQILTGISGQIQDYAADLFFFCLICHNFHPMPSGSLLRQLLFLTDAPVCHLNAGIHIIIANCILV